MKIEIRTENASGDEEVNAALRKIVEAHEEGEVEGLFILDGNGVEWALNPLEPLIR